MSVFIKIFECEICSVQYNIVRSIFMFYVLTENYDYVFSIVSYFFYFSLRLVAIVSLYSSFGFCLLFISLSIGFQIRTHDVFSSVQYSTAKYMEKEQENGAFVSNHLFNFMVQRASLCKISQCLARSERVLKTSGILAANIKIEAND